MYENAMDPRFSTLLADQDHTPVGPWELDPSELLTGVGYHAFPIRVGSHMIILTSLVPTLPAWVIAVAQSLNRISDLRANWDSYGARPVPQDTLEFAFKKIVDLRNDNPNLPIPLIGATVTGGVELEWHDKDLDLELHIKAPGRMSAYFNEEAVDEEWEGPVNPDLEEIEDFLTRCIK